SAMYRFRKFARRNKAVLATATVLAVAMFVALGSLLSTVEVLRDSNEQIKQEQKQTIYALAREERAKEDLNTASNASDRTRTTSASPWQTASGRRTTSPGWSNCSMPAQPTCAAGNGTT